MNKLLACLAAVVAISMTANESQAQCYRGGSGFSIGVGSGFNNFGYSNFNRGYGRSVSGLSISIGNGGFGPYGGFAPVNRGFYGGVPYYAARPVIVPVAPVYRGGGFYGGGGYYGGYRGGGYRPGCGGW